MDVVYLVVVYLLVGVGGSFSGVVFGFKMIMGVNIYFVFCELIYVLFVILGMMIKLNEKIVV